MPSFALSPDGRQIVFSAADGTGTILWRVGESADYCNPSLSPDGKRLAVGVRDPKTNVRDIWLFDLARGGKWQVSVDGGEEPQWRRDGTTGQQR